MDPIVHKMLKGWRQLTHVTLVSVRTMQEHTVKLWLPYVVLYVVLSIDLTQIVQMLLNLLLLLDQLHLLSKCCLMLRQLRRMLPIRLTLCHEVHVWTVKLRHLRDLVALFGSNNHWSASVLLGFDAWILNWWWLRQIISVHRFALNIKLNVLSIVVILHQILPTKLDYLFFECLLFSRIIDKALSLLWYLIYKLLLFLLGRCLWSKMKRK